MVRKQFLRNSSVIFSTGRPSLFRSKFAGTKLAGLLFPFRLFSALSCFCMACLCMSPKVLIQEWAYCGIFLKHGPLGEVNLRSHQNQKSR